MRRVSTALITAFAFMFVALVTVTNAQNPGGSPEGKKMVNAVKSSADSIAAGKTIYLRNCRFCHGEDAKGAAATAPKTLTTVPSNLTDEKWDRGSTDGEIFMVIRHGAGPKFEMKENKLLKDEDIWNIVNFLRSVGPAKK